MNFLTMSVIKLDKIKNKICLLTKNHIHPVNLLATVCLPDLFYASHWLVMVVP